MGLLPANATALERALETVIAELLEGVEVPVRALRDPAVCPEGLLPWLAWERRLPAWDADWPAASKRAAIAAAHGVHARKGTLSADRAVLEAAGAVYDYTERPDGVFGRVRVDVLNSDALLLSQAALRAALERTGRASVHYELAFAAGLCVQPRVAAGFGAAAVARWEARL